MGRKIVRKLRHWKQQYDKNAEFICRRSFKWDDIVTKIGDIIPKALFENKGKLENFWEADWIELAEFEDEVVDEPYDLPDGVSVEKGKGSWMTITLPDGSTVKKNGQKQLAAFIADYTPPEPEPEPEPVPEPETAAEELEENAEAEPVAEDADTEADVENETKDETTGAAV